ncbi:sporulation peptidase YabG [Thermoanaerobacterium thermosaccharolyticum]|uniref:Sporulation peptidase YabG n=3 Tax=Thermoanaerobacterium thermosaccharolyticum TaxID=1517 RepID=D9TPJ7_THETC|nr:sporulation peptidase YabG [Thermoanaerobacterium thermosaccharolyticum]ADL67779.1 sporulation peptidase YabG [Thermoanaerobacterium thermosaccharolyticum DSM 571]AST57622.1 sporulation peptidase [Thermoanaerobacterium thermosaccharolyticum]MBE0068257.1 sporulation peptidase YabG [Thermoanaerobacterium thermosaccharolyticum]MBE0228152.1 sporulation peptidase YabG [Thermoanaerobacterium thermosaccharolyticum]OXT07073.1 sporulation peptidase YabG [Thermoanaerobacterium thermosaccharolyticum]
MPFKVNDIVVRKSHGFDLLFKVIDVIENRGTKHYLLHGLNMRIVADAPEDDLMLASLTRINEYDEPYQRKANYLIKKIAQSKDLKKSSMMRSNRSEPYGKPGTVLHIDGDEGYLNICLDAYKKANIEAHGEIVDEKEQPDKVVSLLSKYRPDILVLTGHDGVKNSRNYSDINNYRNSKYFVEAVKNARNYEPSLDDLVIFAGACQSNYEALISSGANYASSPERVLIHCLDPVLVCEKVAYSHINEIVKIEELIENTITGAPGIGGLQTMGKFRYGVPKAKF